MASRRSVVRDFVHDPAAYYVYTTLELTQYLRQIRPECFFQHADMFDHRVTRVHRAVNGIEAPRFRSMKVTTTRVVRGANLAQPRAQGLDIVKLPLIVRVRHKPITLPRNMGCGRLPLSMLRGEHFSAARFDAQQNFAGKPVLINRPISAAD